MRVTPRTQEEIDLENCMPDGAYDFEVVKAEDKISKKGKEAGLTEPNMIEVNLKVYHGEGYSFVRDWLLEAMPGKLLHFVNETGLADKYGAGEFAAADCLGKCGKVHIKIEAKDGFEPKNAVKDYGEGKKKADQSTKGPLMNAGPKQVIEDEPDDTTIPF